MSAVDSTRLGRSASGVRADLPGYRRWVVCHPVAAFFLGAYTFSWFFWAPAMFGLEGWLVSAALLVGAFGPAVSGTCTTKLTNGETRDWLRGLFRWRGAGSRAPR